MTLAALLNAHAWFSSILSVFAAHRHNRCVPLFGVTVEPLRGEERRSSAGKAAHLQTNECGHHDAREGLPRAPAPAVASGGHLRRRLQEWVPWKEQNGGGAGLGMRNE
jgi:hypothetical protein